MNKIDLCLQIAMKAHAGPADKNGELYILHPLTVGLMGATDEQRMAGFLHNVVEDCDWTLFDAYDLNGKTIIPFCTSGSSPIAIAVKEIHSLEPTVIVLNGRRFNGSDSQQPSARHAHHSLRREHRPGQHEVRNGKDRRETIDNKRQ